ncbi:MAG: YbaB/EbfC family nucleoid-associated protein [Termitinemataceae bacterium]|nr:MAG: YbaB/EbfC family nucleoid-associated protein [Termitinemataceae bacterium]
MNINPFDILKNAQKIQSQIGTFQDRLLTVVVTGSSGGGMVEIDLNGRCEMLAVRISAELLKENDVQMLQDLILAAHTQAQEKVKSAVQSEMSEWSTEIGLPDLGAGGFPFP